MARDGMCLQGSLTVHARGCLSYPLHLPRFAITLPAARAKPTASHLPHEETSPPSPSWPLLECLQMYGGQGGGADWVQLQRAYDYTLDQVGQDIASGVIWQEYVTFLKV